MEFLLKSILSIIVIIVVILILIIIERIGNRQTVKDIILSLVVQAEKALGSGTGDLKYAYVIDKLYDKLPKIVSFLYSREEIDKMIEAAVLKLKDVLKDNTTLSGYDDEVYLDRLGNDV